MDTIIEKLIEIIKEKASKKQVIAIIGIICLFMLGAPPIYIAAVTIYAITAQTVLDYKNPFKEKKDVEKNVSESVSD